jgi:hypothetical protein
MMTKILGHVLHIDVYIDSQTVFDTVKMLEATMEKRQQMDAAPILVSYLRGKLNSLHWIPSAEKDADALTNMP